MAVGRCTSVASVQLVLALGLDVDSDTTLGLGEDLRLLGALGFGLWFRRLMPFCTHRRSCGTQIRNPFLVINLQEGKRHITLFRLKKFCTE